MNVNNYHFAGFTALSDGLYSAANFSTRESSQRVEANPLPETELSKDSVSFSSTVVSISAERQMRLLSIKDAVVTGSYSVAASDVANAMLKQPDRS